MRIRISLWANTPIVIPRSALVAYYLGTVYFGLVSMSAGVPAFEELAPSWYSTAWGACLAVAGLIAAIASISERTVTWEKWSALVVFSLLTAYVGSQMALGFGGGDTNRQALAAGILLTLFLALARFVSLAKQGTTHATPVVQA